MSEQQNNGQRRNQGGNRNNNRNNSNRNNNRNRSNNNNSNRSNNNRNHKKSAPKPLVLSGWQKFLKMIGLFNEEKALKAHQQAEKVNKSLNQKSKPSHKREDSVKPGTTKKAATKPNNTRNAKPRRAPEKVPVETPRLYVGNLSYDASDSDIEELFKGIGNVKNVEIIYNRHTHRSKGYGFVQMFNTDDAKRAVEVLHDQPFLGRNLIVNGSKARNPDDPAAQENNDNAETSETTTV